MSKRIIECPECGGTTLSIRQGINSYRCYTLEKNKLYKVDDEFPTLTGVIWVMCLDHCQDEGTEYYEWEVSPEEARDLSQMLLEPRCADVTEYMEKEHDGE